jgi:prevent-host-death family protein
MKGLSLERMPIRAVRESFGALVDSVATGRRILVCRRTTPMAVLLPRGDFDTLDELAHRDEQLAAVLRGRGFVIDPWTTTNLIEAVAQLGERR